MQELVQALIQVISTVGFPIACCCFLLYQNAKQDAYNREQQEKLRQTIDANTASMNALSDLIKEELKKK